MIGFIRRDSTCLHPGLRSMQKYGNPGQFPDPKSSGNIMTESEMRTYIRVRSPGGCYFFTVNLAQRQNNDLLIEHIDELRAAFRDTRRDHPFDIEGIVVLPDHLHCLWRLPPDEDDFPMRWQLIKTRFSRRIQPGERIPISRQRKGERGVWQPRYWEHLIRDDDDYQRHLDYIHNNPVKHGYVNAPREWPHSSFRRHVALGHYPMEWAAPMAIAGLDWD